MVNAAVTPQEIGYAPLGNKEQIYQQVANLLMLLYSDLLFDCFQVPDKSDVFAVEPLPHPIIDAITNNAIKNILIFFIKYRSPFLLYVLIAFFVNKLIINKINITQHLRL